MSEHKWMSSGFLQAAPIGEVSAEKGVIEGVSIATVGEAEGHGVSLDREFIGRVVSLGNEKKQGLKARFGHPNMCSTALGTFIGRFKNFRQDGDQARADLFVSNEAKDTPHGDLHSYVFGMAENEPDMFGTSIVFTPGQTYRRDKDGNKAYEHVRNYGMGETEVWYTDEDGQQVDEDSSGLSEELFVECDALHACDAVDEPAANDGLFSRFSQETIAGQITEFLDLHPQVWSAFQSNPSILAALARHGDKMDVFTTRYREYLERTKRGLTMITDATTNSEQLEEGTVAETSATDATTEATEEATTETAVEADAETTETETETATEQGPELSRAEFGRIADEFGNDIAVATVRDGGTYETAFRAHAEATAAECVALRARVAELEATQGGGRPAQVKQDEGKKPGLFKTGK